MEKMNITNQDHDAFVKNHPNGDLLQLTKWAETKQLTGWYSKRIAVGENGEVKGVGQLLFKKVPKLPFALCYVSRGFVTDYNDKLALEALLEYAIQVAKDDESLIQSFERRNRSKVRLALKRGTTVERAGRDGLETFANLMKITGERDGFLTRDISYFQNIYDALHEDGDAELFLVKLEPKPVLTDLRAEMIQLEQERAKLLEKKQDKKTLNKINDVDNKVEKTQALIQDMETLEQKHPDGMYLSGALLMFAGDKSYYLYGASSNEYRDFLPNHHMQFAMMQYARQQGAKTYDFGGTDNDPDKDSSHYGLWTFKKVWGTYLSEKIGEFDYVLNKPLYQVIENVKPKLTKAKITVSKKIKRK